MIVSQVYDKLKEYIDLKLSNLETALTTLFQTYKTKEVGTNINAVLTNYENISNINFVANNYSSIDALAGYYTNNNIEVGANAQFLGNQPIKAIQYMSNTNSENIVIKSGLSAFAIDHLDNTNNASLTIENGAVFKIL